jgi:hypothetical protein
MNNMSQYGPLRQIALYLLCWKAGNVRFVPETAKTERDHAEIIGDDGANQLFWYPEGLAKIVFSDNVRRILSFTYKFH